MFTRLSNSWELVKASAAVLRDDKELIVFPIISTVGVLLVTISFALPMIFAGVFDSIISGQENNAGVISFIVALLFYVAQYFVIIFFNSALIGAAMIRLRGGDPTLSDGFRIAFSHIGSIFGYALIASTVGIILRTISERSRWLGRIVVSLIGLVWNLATFLVVPVLVVEDVGPFEAVKRSAQLLKRTWGEQIVGNLSIGVFFGALTIAVIFLIIAPSVYLMIALENPAIMIVMGFLLVALLVLISLISSTLSGIYAAAVYRFAAEGETGGYFEPELVQNAFRRK
ncbi:MAG: hypothetical protein JSV37_09860 [Anaerolineaceae bacterium]|nr:MAG: hypothetical protein JSV37_09860 [Anaerolineaceae bacterium]